VDTNNQAINSQWINNRICANCETIVNYGNRCPNCGGTKFTEMSERVTSETGRPTIEHISFKGFIPTGEIEPKPQPEKRWHKILRFIFRL
jgi:hypothetical protein